MPATSRNTALLLLGTLASLAGCARVDTPPYQETVLDGTRVRTYRTTQPPMQDPYRIEPVAVLGNDQGPDTYLLSSVSVFGVDGSGNVLVNDIREGRIHRFAADGSHLGSFGRRGEGPGEFGPRSYSIFTRSDSLYVLSNNGRLSRFTLTGEFSGSVRLELGSNPFVLSGPPEITVLTTLRAMMMVPSSNNIGSSGLRVRMIDLSSLIASTVLDTTFEHTVAMYQGSGGRRIYGPYYKRYVPLSSMGSSGLVAIVWGDAYRVDFLDPITDRRWALELPVEPERVRSEHRERIVERFEEDQRPWARRNLIFGQFLPCIGWLLWDASGRLWAERYVLDPDLVDERDYDVFDQEGTWLFSQALPKRPDYITEDRFFVRDEDEAGAPIIRSFRLNKN